MENESLKILKDGQECSLSNDRTLSEEGEYIVSFNSTERSISNADSSDEVKFIIDKTLPFINGIKTNSLIEDEEIEAAEFLNASDNSGQVKIEFITEPKWNQIGIQIIYLNVTDLAGNTIKKSMEINIKDKCDLDENGEVDILDLSSLALDYNKNKNESSWNSRLDINKDNIIDIFDLVICSKRIK